jgi:hypothetical protein
MSVYQGSPHIVKTGRLDFSLSWLKGEVRENLGDFRKSIQILTILSPLLHVPLPFTKRTCCTMILKRMQLRVCMGQISGTWELLLCVLKKKYDYCWKISGLEKTDRATKTSLFDRNWAISLNQGKEVAHFVWFGEPWYIIQ